MRESQRTGIAIGRRNSYDSPLSSRNRVSPSMSQQNPAAIRSTVVPHDIRLYGLEFWIAYFANLLIVTANTLTFRFSEFVVSLKGSAADAAFIVGVGTGVSVLVRIWM